MRETGSLGVFHLKRLWSSVLAVRQGGETPRNREWHLDRLVIDALGIGLNQTLQYLFQNAPDFAEFEAWIVETAGRPDSLLVDRLNADIEGHAHPERIRSWLDSIERSEPVLTADDLARWERDGYVVVRNAVDVDACRAAEKVIWDYLESEPDKPASWYRQSARHGIMVELIQHPALQANRRAPRIHKAFAQLWGTADLWVTADRCGFHPPQTEAYPFPGPDLHWDIDFGRPPVFGTQGILYLTDTPAEQGALTLVPGFLHRLAEWLQGLEPGADPQKQDLHALGSKPVGGLAGDLVIWNQLLPHGSRPNLGARPRIVQYINMYPGRGNCHG